jgi:hypothetical protein
MPVCLPGTIRSQGFSPSQRFHPARASWLCFAPHPPLGFGIGLQSFSHPTSRDASRRPWLSCRSGWLRIPPGEPEFLLRPCRRSHHRDLSLAELRPSWYPVLPRAAIPTSSRSPSRRSGSVNERAAECRCPGGRHQAPNTARPVRERPVRATTHRLEPATSERCSG